VSNIFGAFIGDVFESVYIGFVKYVKKFSYAIFLFDGDNGSSTRF
jgi:hypothetical protein